MEQVEYGVDTNDEKFRREWQRAYNIISGGKIGEIYVLSGLDGYVISAIHTSNGYRSMIFENLKNIKDIGSKESVYLDVWIDMVDLEQREDEYYVKKKDGMKKWNLHWFAINYLINMYYKGTKIKRITENSSPFLLHIKEIPISQIWPLGKKEFNNASIKQIKDGIIQSGILYRVIVWLDCVKYIKKMLTSTC